MFMVDITDETKPYSVSNFYVPEESGNFCARGGRFGTHSSHEDMGPIYYKKLVFISWFNAGLRVVDIRDPFTPREVAYYIPAITKNTALGAVVAVGEILYQAQGAYSFSYNPSPLTMGALAYLVLFLPVVWFGRWVETRFAWKR